MSPDEIRIWTLIAERHGRAQAIPVSAIERVTGLSDRAIRRAVKSLIERHGAPIASAPQPPSGYYIPETLAEIIDTTEGLRHRALSILLRMSRLKRTTLRETVDQLLLDIHEDAA